MTRSGEPGPADGASPGNTLFRPGHAAGDVLGAPDWQVQVEAAGFLRLGIELPARLRNPAGQLFGGFTATYVDLIALATVYAGSDEPRLWLATTSLRVEYLAPLTGPDLVVESRLRASRGRTRVVDMSFHDRDESEPAVIGSATLRQLPARPG